MLILTRVPGEETMIGGDADGHHTLFDARGNPVPITLTILGVKGRQVRIGITAPKSIPVHRKEIADRIRREHGGGGDVNGNVAPEGAAA